MKPGDKFGIDKYYDACTTCNKHNETYEEKWTVANISDNQYEIVIMQPLSDETLKENRIAELKKKLADTDYIYNIIREGDATEEDYEDVIKNRKEWRAEVRRLQEGN